MKNALMLTLACMSFATLAQTSSIDGVAFTRPGTKGEYPSVFQLKSDLSLMISSRAEPRALKSIKCSLKKNKKIDLSKLKAVTHSYSTAKFDVLKPITLQVLNEGDGSTTRIEVLAGEQVENVSYYSEGMCAVRYHGEVFDTSCVENHGGDDYLKPTSILDLETWVEIKCANKVSGWINERSLEGNKKIRKLEI